MATDENTRIRNGIVDIYSKFISDVDVETKILDILIQEKVVRMEFATHLRARKDIGREDKCRQLLSEMFSNNNPRSFIVLREALQTAHFYWIVEWIDKTAATNGDQQLLRTNITLNEENEQLKSQVQTLKQSTVTTRDNNRQVELRKSQLEIDDDDDLTKRRLQHGLDGLRIDLEEARKKLEQKDKELKDLKEQHMKELTEQALQFKQQIDEEKKTIVQLRGEVASLKHQLGEISGEVAKWRASCDRETTRAGDLEAVLKKERTRYDAEKKRLNEELDVAKERANESDRKLESAHRDHRLQLSNEATRSRAVADQVKTLQCQLREREESEAQLKRSLKDNDLEMKGLKQQADKTSKESESFQRQVAALQSQLEKSEEKAEGLETKISQQNKEMESLKRTADDKLRSETTQLTRQLEKLEEQLRQSRESNSKLKEAVDEKSTEIQRLTKLTNERSSSVSASLEVKNKEISSLSKKLKVAENELMKQTNSSANSELMELVKDAEYREKQTSEQLQEKSVELERTKDEIGRLTELNRQQEAKIKQLEGAQRQSAVVNKTKEKGARDRAPTPPAPLMHRTESSTHVKVLYDYTSQDGDELSINEGEILTDVQPVDDGWATGTNKAGKKGMFPRNYCEDILETQSSCLDYDDAAAAVGAPPSASDHVDTYEMLHFGNSDEDSYFNARESASMLGKVYQNIKPVMPDTDIEAATTADNESPYLVAMQPASAPVTGGINRTPRFGVGPVARQTSESTENSSVAAAVGKRTVKIKTSDLKPYQFRLDKNFKVTDHNQVAVVGLAELGGLLFVVREKSPNVFVYDIKDTSKPRPPIKLQPGGATRLHRLLPTTTVKPCDIVACKHNKCLYVSDRAIGSVVVVQQPTDTAKTSERCKPWLVDGLPYGLSVTSSNHNVLVCFPIDHRLNEYDHDGKLIHRINLPSAIAQPWKGIELESRRWIVCHGGGSSGSRRDSTSAVVLHRVCLVDGAQKQVTMSHGKQPGVGPDQLSEPRSIVIDSKQRVLVADCRNNRIKVLGVASGLQQLQVLSQTTNDKLIDSPCRLHLYESENISRLFVGLQNGQVLCYEV